jgi:hypothetical protein
MDDFGVANADYFQDMYRDICPEEAGIRLIPSRVEPKPGRLVECKLLDTLIFVDEDGTVHATLYDKRADYNFFVNRFPDICSMRPGLNLSLPFMGKLSGSFVTLIRKAFSKTFQRCPHT